MKRFLFIALSASVLWSCYPGGAEFVEDIDVVYTNYDQSFDFKGKSTYAMPDKIVVDVSKDQNGDYVPEYMPAKYADPILKAIADKMTANGWARVDPVSTMPDVVVTPAAIKSTTYFYSYWYNWWYGGWYGGYWGWYYPPYYSISSITTGSLVISMADPSAASDSPINSSPVIWLAVGNGLFTGAYNMTRVTKAIDQAFAQSPYLKTN